MLAHLGSILGPCSPILGLCRGYIDRPEIILGLCYFHNFILTPKFCLKKLSPMAYEVPFPFLQCNFSQKVEVYLERAHPRQAPEGSHQWPARFQETLFEGSMVPPGPPLTKVRFACATAQPDLKAFGQIRRPL